MAVIKVLAGDFLPGNADYSWGSITLLTEGKGFFADSHNISINELESIDIATEDSVKKLGGTVGWGVAGAALLGPAGLLAGLLLGGKKKEVTFVAKFNDGRKFMGTSDSKTYAKLLAAAF
jgi:hypothetical protein